VAERISTQPPDPAALGRGEGAASVAGRGTLWLFLARLAFMGGGLVISILLARALGPAVFGIYGLVMSLLTWAEFVVGSGAPGSIARLAPQHDRDPAFARIALGLTLAAGLAVTAVALLASPLLTRLFGIADGRIFPIVFLDIPLMAVVFGCHGLLYARGRLELLAAAIALQTLVKMAGILLVVVAGLGLLPALVAHLVGTAAALALLIGRLPVRLARPRPPVATALLAAALPLTTYALVYQAQANLGLWLLGAFGEDLRAATGHYNAAMNVARVLTLVPAVLSSVLFAKVAEAVSREDLALAARELRTGFRFALILLAPAVAALAADAGPVVDLLYGARFAPAAAMLVWLGVAVAVTGLLDLLLQTLLAHGRHRLALAILGGGSSVMLVATLPLFAWFGALGVALAMTVGIGSALLVAAVVTRRRLGGFLGPLSVSRILGASLALFLVLRLLDGSGMLLLAEFLLAGLGYFALLFLLREITPAELRTLLGRERP